MINIINIFIHHYKVNYIVQLVPIVILGVGFPFIMESPYVLFKIKNIKELMKTLFYIGKVNNKDVKLTQEEMFKALKLESLGIKDYNEIKMLKIEPIEKEKVNSLRQYWRGIRTVFHHKPLLWKLLGAAIIAGNIYVGYGLSILIPQRIGLSNIYVNGIFLGVSELIGNFIVIPLGDKVKRRWFNFTCSLTIVLCCVVLLIFELVKDSIQENVLKWTQTLISSVIKLALCANFALIFTYCSELFPTKMRGLCLGLCVLVGRTSSIFALGLEGITDRIGIHPMIGVIFGTAITLPISLVMPETFGKGVSN